MKGRHLVRHTLMSKMHETNSSEAFLGANKDLLTLTHGQEELPSEGWAKIARS